MVYKGKVGNEESLSGYASLELDTFYNYQKDNFTDQKIAALNAFDVGRYDGFLSHEFPREKKCKSLEPRI
jgi:hypothetical protein